MNSRALAFALGLLLPQAGSAEVLSYTLPNTVGSDWWYGCVPTSVGMMLAYYDVNGYGGGNYDNLIPGGTPTTATGLYPSGNILRDAIASTGYQRDFYSGETYGYNDGGQGYIDGDGYWVEQNFGLRNDDLPTTRAFDCIADFVGCGQDSSNCMNGDTPIYFNRTGERFYYSGGILDVPSYGTVIDMVYGIDAYVAYRGYDIEWAYTQNTDNHCRENSLSTTGFTFADFCAEIDAGRPVILNLFNPAYEHAILGVGYDRESTSIRYYNTWDGEIHTLSWTGTLRDMYIDGAYAMELALVPEPSAFAALAGLFAAAFALRRRTGGGISA